MKMFLIPLEDHENLTCEHCGEEDGKYGAVKNETVLNLWVLHHGMTKIEATQYLLWEEAKGMILCASCLKGADMRNFLSFREYVTDTQIGLTSLKTLKVGDGVIAWLEISKVKNNSVVTLYDNISASGTILWISGPMTAQDRPFLIKLGGIFFNIGLSLSITGADSNVITLYA